MVDKLPTFILITCDALHALVPFVQFKKRKKHMEDCYF